MEHLDPDELVLLALGEWTLTDGTSGASGRPADDSVVPVPSMHLLECASCRDELTQLEYTVQLAREAGELGLQADVVLPPSIWSGIAQELGIGSGLGGGAGAHRSSAVGAQATGPGRERPASPPPFADRRLLFEAQAHPVPEPEAPRVDNRAGSRRPSHRSERPRVGRGSVIRRGLLTAAVVAAVGIGIGTGLAINGRDTQAPAAVQSQAQLAPIDNGPATAHGTATITEGVGGLALQVTARQLPLRQGYYEVWLYNPTADQMVAVGTLGSGGDGAWSLASNIDLQAYSVVNVSAQDFDGNPVHKSSMLQGPLTR